MATRAPDISPLRQRRLAAWSVWTALSVIAVVVAWRRLVGAFADELPQPAACVIVLSVLALSLLANALFHILSTPAALLPSSSRWFRRWFRFPSNTASGPRTAAALATVAPPLVLSAVLLPPVSGFAIVFFLAVALCAFGGVFVIGVTAAAGGGALPTDWLRSRSPQPAGTRQTTPQGAEVSQPPTSYAGADVLPANRFEGSRVLQRTLRFELPQGGEQVEGVLQAVFAAGRNQAAIHVPFSPPLSAVPSVTCRVLDDTTTRARVTVAKSYGVRVEVKRDGDVSEPASVAVSISASAPPRVP